MVFIILTLLFVVSLVWIVAIICGISLVGTLSVGYFLLYCRPDVLYRFLVRIGVLIAGLTRKTCMVEGGFLFSYMERGTRSEAKRSILMIHGFTSAKEAWTLVIRHLPRDVHVVAVDMPGHGKTTVNPDDAISIFGQLHRLHQFVEKIGLDTRPFHIVGQSMGGAIAGCYSATYPHQVAQLTMVCPAMMTPTLSQFKLEVKAGKRCTLVPENTDQMQEMLDLVLHNKMRLFRPLLSGLYLHRKPHMPYYNKLYKSLSTEDSLHILEEKLPKINAPAQVVWGEHDGVIDISGAAVLKDGLPNCTRVDILQHCGHLVNGERPRRLARLLMEFQYEVRVLGFYTSVDSSSNTSVDPETSQL